MKLDRNINPTGKGKYALINLRRIPGDPRTPEALAAAILANPKCVEFGEAYGPSEFWLTKLKDQYAEPALRAYVRAAMEDDPEYASQVEELANRAGHYSPFCSKPD